MEGSERAAGPNPELDRLRGPIEAVSFWMAVVLPVVYVPLLVVDVAGVADIVLFACLVVFHLVALAVGHTHRR